MSKVGKLPVELPEGVSAVVAGSELVVKGPKGELSLKMPRTVTAKVADSVLSFVTSSTTKVGKSQYGTTRALARNMVTGVSEGFSKVLEIVGTGYRGEVKGADLVLTVGYSHPVTIQAQKGIAFRVEKNDITVEGPDRELVGQTAANIRAVRPPEPYKGKGIRYKDEVVRRKAGKAAKTAGAQ